MASFQKMEGLHHRIAYWIRISKNIRLRINKGEDPDFPPGRWERLQRDFQRAIHNVSRLRRLRRAWRQTSTAKFRVKHRRLLILEEMEEEDV